MTELKPAGKELDDHNMLGETLFRKDQEGIRFAGLKEDEECEWRSCFGEEALVWSMVRCVFHGVEAC